MRHAPLPTRGDGTVRISRDMPNVPPVGPTRVPSSVYTDPERFEQERVKVFRRSWFVVERGSEIPEPGDFLVWEEMGETVVVTRLDDGDVAAFHNVCQHRGARICDPGDTPSGTRVGTCADSFECPWHGFRYGLTGEVVGVPERADFDPAELEDLRAPKVAVREWGGWLWINLSGDDAPMLEEWLGADILEELGHYDMERMVLHKKQTWVMPVNWKAVVDGFIEVYHVGTAHRATIGDLLSTRDTYQTLFDRHSMYVVPAGRNLEELFEHGDHIRASISHYLVFPNSIFNCNPTHIQFFMPIPVDANTSKYTAWNLILPDGDDEFLADMDMRWRYFTMVAEEDLYAAQQVGATRRSMGYTRNIMNERECRIPHFLDQVEKLLAE
jgi:phenylpropionate dioxygenase-like ring-hydroxylating dioxygenase large terminal subunit